MPVTLAALGACFALVSSHYGVKKADLVRAVQTPVPMSIGVAHIPRGWLPLLRDHGFNIDVVQSDPCQSVAAAGWILRYTSDVRKMQAQARRGLPARAAVWQPLIASYSAQYGVDPNLVNAVILRESDFNPSALSSANAYGLMQLTPDTARYLGVNRSIPEQNLKGGIYYLSLLLRQYQGNVVLALAAYNAGPSAVSKYRGVPPFRETRDYIPAVLNHYTALTQVAQISASARALPILEDR